MCGRGEGGGGELSNSSSGSRDPLWQSPWDETCGVWARLHCMGRETRSVTGAPPRLSSPHSPDGLRGLRPSLSTHTTGGVRSSPGPVGA